MMQITITLTEESVKVAKLAIDGTDKSIPDFVSEQIEKTLDQKRVQFARSRLNLGKALRHKNITRGIKGFESLEASYLAEGMAGDVFTFGGIMKVYTEIFAKSGFTLPADKIRMTVVAVNQPKQA